MDFCPHCHMETDSLCDYCNVWYCRDCQGMEHSDCRFNRSDDIEDDIVEGEMPYE